MHSLQYANIFVDRTFVTTKPQRPDELAAPEGRTSTYRTRLSRVSRCGVCTAAWRPTALHPRLGLAHLDLVEATANRVIGRFLVWERATTGEEARHWRDERIRTRLEVRAVDPDDRRAVEAKTAELRQQLAQMPDSAPVLA